MQTVFIMNLNVKLFFKRKSELLLLVLMAFALVSCSKDDDTTIPESNALNEAIMYPFSHYGYPCGVILDTDIGSSTDDLLAMHLLYRMMQVGQIDLKGIMVDREGLNFLRMADIMNTYYGFNNIPIGQVHDGAKDPNVYIDYWKMADPITYTDEPVFARTLTDEQLQNTPAAEKLYRKILSESKDRSIIIVSLGFTTNLAHLLETGPDEYSPLTGVELVRQKVALLSQMGGHLIDDDGAGYNFKNDKDNTRIVFDKWPTIILFSPSETGDLFEYAPETIFADLQAGNLTDSPIYHAYSHHNCNTGQCMWDVMTILHMTKPELFTFNGPYSSILMRTASARPRTTAIQIIIYHIRPMITAPES